MKKAGGEILPPLWVLTRRLIAKRKTMSLKIKLKPNERIIVAGASITNGGTATTLILNNKVPVLRERDILRQEEADTPAKRIYFIAQVMYIDPNGMADHHKIYWQLAADYLKAAPSALHLIDCMSTQILGDKYYEALKTARKLIAHEGSRLHKTGETKK